MKNVPRSLWGFYDSISSLHAVEHFGLGRYGDELDYEGHLKGFRLISQLVAPGGTFYFSVPIGPQRIEFNAHRVFSLPYLRRMWEKDFWLERFSYIDDAGMVHENVPCDSPDADRSYGCNYGLGIFELAKMIHADAAEG
jgi:hypothetical protein